MLYENILRWSKPNTTLQWTNSRSYNYRYYCFCFWFVAPPNRLDRANLPGGQGTGVMVGVLSSSHYTAAAVLPQEFHSYALPSVQHTLCYSRGSGHKKSVVGQTATHTARGTEKQSPAMKNRVLFSDFVVLNVVSNPQDRVRTLIMWGLQDRVRPMLMWSLQDRERPMLIWGPRIAWGLCWCEAPGSREAYADVRPQDRGRPMLMSHKDSHAHSTHVNHTIASDCMVY